MMDGTEFLMLSEDKALRGAMIANVKCLLQIPTLRRRVLLGYQTKASNINSCLTLWLHYFITHPKVHLHEFLRFQSASLLISIPSKHISGPYTYPNYEPRLA